MPTYQHQISLADLSAVGLRLRPSEGATIARDIAQRVALGEFPGIPSAHVLRLAADGRIHIEGPVGSDREVERAARLLEALLPGFDAPPESRVPGALRLVLARALGTLDLPSYESLDDFANALSRFAASDARACISDICAGWSAAAVATPELVEEAADANVDRAPLQISELTISDVRRARRATRLTLSDISERTRIPVTLLREFEWGYFANWPSGFYGRTQIVRYARAAGLDEHVVVETVLPLLEQQPGGAGAFPATQLIDAEVLESPEAFDERHLVPVAAAPLVSNRRRSVSRGAKWGAALAIPALVAIGVAPAVWNARPEAERPAVEAARPGSKPSTAPVVVLAPARSETPAQVAPAPVAPAAAEERPTATSGATAVTAESGSAPLKNGVTPPPPNDAVAARYPASEVTAAGFSPAFATEGSAMFYHADAPARTSSAIMRADTDDNGAILRVTSIVNDRARNFHARPSPDGGRIAFDSDRDGERGVYIADANGDNVHRVTGEGFAAVPSWSPDGRRLAFVRAEANRPKVWNLWTMETATGAMRRVTSNRIGQPWGAAWFPDGERIAYSHETRLIVRALDGSGERIFNSPVPGRLVRTPAVSPDGQRIMFQVYRNGAWLLDLRDSSMRRVLADPSAEEFTWSPDGRRVAYHSRRSGTWGVWVMLAS
ncbi:MAG: helix-turn-helix domain-containing protein [Vicinamibacterales bacterium]